MATGLGVDPTKNGAGVVTSGTTAQDIRQIYGGLFSPGLVSGAKVTTSASSMTYTVAAGVCMIQTATGQVVPAPIPPTVINMTSTGGSSRTDIIYAKQHFPTTDGDSQVVVACGTSAPSNSVVIATYFQPSGASNSDVGHVTDSPDFSIPYGASLGNLYTYQHTYTGLLPDASAGITRIGQNTFKLPTDRRVLFKMTAVLQSQGAVGFDNSKYCEYGFLPSIDGGDIVLWTTPGLHQALASYSFEQYFTLPAGTHTTNLAMLQMTGAGRAYTFYGGDSMGFGRRGITYTIEDAGVAQ